MFPRSQGQLGATSGGNRVRGVLPSTERLRAQNECGGLGNDGVPKRVRRVCRRAARGVPSAEADDGQPIGSEVRFPRMFGRGRGATATGATLHGGDGAVAAVGSLHGQDDRVRRVRIASVGRPGPVAIHGRREAGTKPDNARTRQREGTGAQRGVDGQNGTETQGLRERRSKPLSG